MSMFAAPLVFRFLYITIDQTVADEAGRWLCCARTGRDYFRAAEASRALWPTSDRAEINFVKPAFYFWTITKAVGGV